MRRIPFACVAVAIAFAVTAGVAVRTDAVAQQEQFRQVNIRVNCANGQVSATSIEPWNIRASRSAGHQLRWRLLPASDVNSATIRPKSDSSWPFATEAPITVTSDGNRTVDSGPISAAPGAYFYDVVVNCGNGPYVIDPRMDIDP